MALKGEGDPRWIVDARADGKNVNNWHWTESDFSKWSEAKLQELIKNQSLNNDKIDVSFTSLSMEGEVSVNTRKQKTFLFYEMDVTIKWAGKLKATGTEGNGTIKIPNISEENDEDDFTVNFSVDDENKEKSILKDEVRRLTVPFLKKKIPEAITALREHTKQYTKLNLKEQPSAKVLDKVDVTPTTSPTTSPAEVKATETKKASTSVSIDKNVTIVVKDKFFCTPRDLYESLLFPGRVKAYAGTDAEVSMEKGGKFKLFGGSVVGENLELIPDKKIVQKWRFSSWPEGHYSTVTIDLEDNKGKTGVTLQQTNVPEKDKERTEGGWKDNFFRRIKGIFGYGGLM